MCPPTGDHLGRDLGALAGDLSGREPSGRLLRFLPAPLIDGPPLLGRPLQDGGHRAVRMLVGRGDHRLGSGGPLIHRLPLRGFEDRQAHLVGLVESQAGRALRQRLDLSQARFAELVRAASKAVVYQWESRKRCPSPVFWRRIEELWRTRSKAPRRLAR